VTHPTRSVLGILAGWGLAFSLAGCVSVAGVLLPDNASGDGSIADAGRPDRAVDAHDATSADQRAADVHVSADARDSGPVDSGLHDARTGGDSADAPAPGFTIGGIVTGLASGDTVVLQDNGGNNLAVSGNGAFTFTSALPAGAMYSVTVLTNPTAPTAMTCLVSPGTGTGTVAMQNVTGVLVTCGMPMFTVGGTISGLGAGDTIVLQDDLGDNLLVTANGAFTFHTLLPANGPYSVTVLANPNAPSPVSCSVSGATGNANANVTNVAVTCVTAYTVGGTLSGLVTGDTVVLEDNGGDKLSLTTNGPFTFANPLVAGATYSATVLTSPTLPTPLVCAVSGGAGTIATSDVKTIQVTCAPPTYTIGGTLTGVLAGDTVVLKDNGGDALSLTTTGPFTFHTPLQAGAAYSVTAANPTTPTPITCNVTGGSGLMPASDLTTVAVACAPPLDFGLVSVWNFEGNGNDSVGNNTLIQNPFSGTTPSTYSAGKLGQGLTNTSQTDGLYIAMDPITWAGDFTVSVWAERVGTTVYDNDIILSSDAFTLSQSWEFGTPPNPAITPSVYGVDLSAAGGAGAYLVDNSGVGLPIGQWLLIVFWRQGNTAGISVNGQGTATLNVTGFVLPSTGSLFVATQKNGYQFEGTLDQLAIWSRALSAAEIAALYNGGAGVALP
jgi:hypothetical protein